MGCRGSELEEMSRRFDKGAVEKGNVPHLVTSHVARHYIASHLEGRQNSPLARDDCANGLRKLLGSTEMVAVGLWWRRVVRFFYLEVTGETVLVGKIDRRNAISIYISVADLFHFRA